MEFLNDCDMMNTFENSDIEVAPVINFQINFGNVFGRCQYLKDVSRLTSCVIYEGTLYKDIEKTFTNCKIKCENSAIENFINENTKYVFVNCEIEIYDNSDELTEYLKEKYPKLRDIYDSQSNLCDSSISSDSDSSINSDSEGSISSDSNFPMDFHEDYIDYCMFYGSP